MSVFKTFDLIKNKKSLLRPLHGSKGFFLCKILRGYKIDKKDLNGFPTNKNLPIFRLNRIRFYRKIIA